MNDFLIVQKIIKIDSRIITDPEEKYKDDMIKKCSEWD
jgi:hypothetical protein